MSSKGGPPHAPVACAQRSGACMRAFRGCVECQLDVVLIRLHSRGHEHMWLVLLMLGSRLLAWAVRTLYVPGARGVCHTMAAPLTQRPLCSRSSPELNMCGLSLHPGPPPPLLHLPAQPPTPHRALNEPCFLPLASAALASPPKPAATTPPPLTLQSGPASPPPAAANPARGALPARLPLLSTTPHPTAATPAALPARA